MAPAEERVEIDMANVTVGDIRQLDHPALKAVMLQVKKQMEEEGTAPRASMQHTSHSVFYSGIV